jgi:hypothetical protein
MIFRLVQSGDASSEFGVRTKQKSARKAYRATGSVDHLYRRGELHCLCGVTHFVADGKKANCVTDEIEFPGPIKSHQLTQSSDSKRANWRGSPHVSINAHGLKSPVIEVVVIASEGCRERRRQRTY